MSIRTAALLLLAAALSYGEPGITVAPTVTHVDGGVYAALPHRNEIGAIVGERLSQSLGVRHDGGLELRTRIISTPSWPGRFHLALEYEMVDRATATVVRSGSIGCRISVNDASAATRCIERVTAELAERLNGSES